MNSMQYFRRMVMTSSHANIARQLARSQSTRASSAVGGVSTSQEHPISHQGVLYDTTHGHDWEVPPLARIQNAVNRFRQEQYIDELPSRTQKSVVEAAAAGKGYVTPEDITRVMVNIAGESVLTTSEAADICKTWGEKPSVEAMASPSMPAATFLRLLADSSK